MLTLFHSVSQKAVATPKVLHLFSDSFVGESLERFTTKCTLLQKSIEDFIEAKRLAFPRFFFMTDKQFLEFVELAEKNYDFHKFINILFPGAAKVFLDQPLSVGSESRRKKNKVPPPPINDSE